MSPDLTQFFLNASVVSAFALYQILERQAEAKRRLLEQQEQEEEWKRRLAQEREDKMLLVKTLQDVAIAMTQLLERLGLSGHGNKA